MNKDAIVAEAVGYKVNTYHTKKGTEWKIVIRAENDIEVLADLPPFISAPTWASDGIVLEWVQGQDGAIYGDFVTKLSGEILRQLSDGEMGVARSGMFSLVWLKYYKPGDYAHALLAVTKDG